MRTRRKAEYEEQPCWAKEDSGAVFNNFRSRLGSRGADITKDVCPEQLDAEPSHIKEEDEKKEVSHLKEEEEQQAQYIKEEALQHPYTKVEVDEPPDIKEEEEEEEIISKGPFAGVLLESINEVDREAPSSSSCQHMTTNGVGNPQEESKADGLLAPLSDSDNTSSNTDDEEKEEEDESEDDLTCNTGNKPWKCSHCGKMYAYKSLLELHTRTHTGEKPFTCSDCGQKFSFKRTLTAHIRTHTGEKPFSCLVCGQRFRWRGCLKKHIRTHTGEKPLACLVYDKKFSCNSNLKRHIRAHTGE
ncbi:zinc finger and SCAN domain-containing protein 31-like isoform X2 [Hippocampus zosterae]|uniref:zinc finger and SCAN domain-containing protein 31-like isoform X2 n=1 Tax=Hippocampus zosterae TaxID=109293 RepID=UPI00223E135C|nr:zinc finger and SCAN domain-containing protein 31-like isoform X2 [Hippocampus zosterae]